MSAISARQLRTITSANGGEKMDSAVLSQQIDREIGVYEAKLADLKAARRVFRELAGSATNGGDMAGLHFAEAARKILNERNNAWMDYKVIVDEAVSRGFNNRSKTTKNVRDTCYHILHRRDDRFEWDGVRVRLKASATE
jgi:hypothetical protein